MAPLLLRGRPVGVLTLLSAKSGPGVYGAQELEVAAEIGRRCGHGHRERARLYRRGSSERSSRGTIFFAMVSHDLRSPAQHSPPSRHSGARRVAKETRRGAVMSSPSSGPAKRMAAIVAELLDAASLEAGHVPLERVPCEARALIDGSRGITLRRSPNRRKLQLAGRGRAWSAERFLCDRMRLGRVLVNLIDNAVKVHRPKGGTVTIRASAHTAETSRSQ